MKIPISIPDDTLERVMRAAREMGIRPSEFFRRAATAYLKEMEATSVTARINSTLELIGEDESSRLAVEASRWRHRELPDEW